MNALRCQRKNDVEGKEEANDLSPSCLGGAKSEDEKTKPKILFQ